MRDCGDVLFRIPGEESVNKTNEAFIAQYLPNRARVPCTPQARSRSLSEDKPLNARCFTRSEDTDPQSRTGNLCDRIRALSANIRETPFPFVIIVG